MFERNRPLTVYVNGLEICRFLPADCTFVLTTTISTEGLDSIFSKDDALYY